MTTKAKNQKQILVSNETEIKESFKAVSNDELMKDLEKRQKPTKSRLFDRKII